MEGLFSALLVALLCLVLPAAAVRQWLFGLPPELLEMPKRRLQARAIFNCLLLGFVAWLAMRVVGVELLRPWHPTLIETAAAPVLLALALVGNRMLSRWMLGDPRRVDLKILPTGPDEYLMWCLVSVAAGVGEELAYRGALFLTLTWWTGEQWVALGVVAISFAAAHLRQGVRASAYIFAFGVMLQLLVMVSGSLVTAILVHAAYNIAVGISASRRPTVNAPGEPVSISAIFHP